jgi:hypothetical protein
MAANPFARARECAKGIVEKSDGKIREATSRLSPRQRTVLLSILFATFVIVDVIYIVQGFRGAGAHVPEIQHLKQIETEILNPIQNDTIPKQSVGR